MGHDDLRRAWFPDWTPDKEESPGGIRDLVGEGAVPVMRDPDEDEGWRISSVPGDDTAVHDRAYKENPYSVMMPRELMALLRDPEVVGEQRRQVMAAYSTLQELEGGKMPTPSEAATTLPPKRQY